MTTRPKACLSLPALTSCIALAATLLGPSAPAHAQITRDDFTSGFRSDLDWSFQSPASGGGSVGIFDNSLLDFSGGRLNIDTRSSGSLFGDNNVPVNVPNLTVVSVPTNWYVETSVIVNLADMSDRSRFTQANFQIYRDVDFFASLTYTNLPDSPTPQSYISSNVQTTLGNSAFGGFGFTPDAFPSNNTLEVRLRVERKTDGTVPGFVLGGSSSGLYYGRNTGSGWETYGAVTNGGTPQQQLTFQVLSQFGPGFHLGLGTSTPPLSGAVPVARFDYIETNLGVATSSAAAPEPASLALLALSCLPVVGAVVRRRVSLRRRCSA